MDTLRLRSPSVPDELARAVEQSCERRTCVEVATGQVLWEIVRGGLRGSYDHRVSVQVERERWVRSGSPAERAAWASVLGDGAAAWRVRHVGEERLGVPVRVPCEPYIRLEGSVHKALVGHNVEGGPEEVEAAARWFVAEVGRRLGVELPAAEEWVVERVDWAEAFRLPSYEACEEYVGCLALASFPRRRVARYGSETVMAVGETTTVKVYHKGPEFGRHDAARVRRWAGEAEAGRLQALANVLVRGEVEIHSDALRAAYGDNATVGRVSTEYVARVYDREMGRLLREGQSEMRIVRTHREVHRRLWEHYDDRLAGLLFGTWLQLASVGEEFVKRHMPRATFYRQRAQLVAVGVAWDGADVRVEGEPRLVPVDFAPLRRDSRRVTGEAPAVVAALAPYRSAVA